MAQHDEFARHPCGSSAAVTGGGRDPLNRCGSLLRWRLDGLDIAGELIDLGPRLIERGLILLKLGLNTRLTAVRLGGSGQTVNRGGKLFDVGLGLGELRLEVAYVRRYADFN